MVYEVITREDKPEEELVIDSYCLLIGFEVNCADTAFIKKKVGILSNKEDYVQILVGEGADYGHTFFYITKNNIVEKFFSFGPRDEIGKEKEKIISDEERELKLYADGYVNARPSTSLYEITEVTLLFKTLLTEEEYLKIINKVDTVNEKIKKGKSYHVLVNDTCAKVAQSILSKVLKDLPDGQGYVQINQRIPPIKFVNPYMWCRQLAIKYNNDYYTYPEYPNLGKAAELFYENGEHEFSVMPWNLNKGDVDPLAEEGYYEEDDLNEENINLEN